MVYGTKMIYSYKENDGDKEIDKKLELVFNPMTLIKYQGYTGREFMTDFMQIGLNTHKKLPKSLQEKIDQGKELNYEDLTNEDIVALSQINVADNYEFFINITAAMIAANAYPKVLDFGEIISSLPLFIFYDDEYLTEIIELISFGLKKNKLHIMGGQTKFR